MRVNKIFRWFRQYRDKLEGPVEAGLSRERLKAELKCFRQENRRLEIEREILKRLWPSLPKRRIEFGYIRQQMMIYPVIVLCRMIGVSPSGFYGFLHRFSQDPGDHPAQGILEFRIRLMFNQARGSYRSRRITRKLKAGRHRIGRYKVRHLMRQFGLKVKMWRHYRVTTDSRHLFPVAQKYVTRDDETQKPAHSA